MIFLLISTVILLLGYIYIGKRVIFPLVNRASGRRILWTTLPLLPLLLPISLILMRDPGKRLLGEIAGWIGFTVLGFFSLVFVFSLMRETIRLIGFLAKQAAIAARRLAGSNASGDLPCDPSRRAFLVHSVNAGILGTSALLSGYGFYEARRRPHTLRVTIPLPQLPPAFEGFTIAQFSDLHVGPTITRSYVETVAFDLGGLGADLIVFTGDLADGSVPALHHDVEPLADLGAPFGKFFVTGNHEYYSGVLQWLEEAERLGFSVLLNEHRMLARGESRILLAGITDYYGGDFLESHVPDPARAFEGAPKGVVRILLAHQPRQIFSALDQGIDLVLSGHTHGGQYIFWNTLVALQQPYLKGLHRHGDSWVYVNRGTGYWGPPLRIGVRSEITLLTLTSSAPVSSTGQADHLRHEGAGYSMDKAPTF